MTNLGNYNSIKSFHFTRKIFPIALVLALKHKSFKTLGRVMNQKWDFISRYRWYQYRYSYAFRERIWHMLDIYASFPFVFSLCLSLLFFFCLFLRERDRRGGRERILIKFHKVPDTGFDLSNLWSWPELKSRVRQ